MVIKKIAITNFRNYNNLTLEFNPSLNIIYGDNGQGKTNLLESIYVLGLTKSYRSYNDLNLIKKHQEFTKLNGLIINEGIPTNLEIVITNKTKKLKMDNNYITAISKYIKKMNIIIFYPEDIDLIKGSPINRRNHLDAQLSQLYENYYLNLNEYNKILKQRNELLKKLNKKQVIDEKLFLILTNSLIERACKIYKYRKNYIDNINQNISLIYKDIMNFEHLKILYKPIINIKNYNYKELVKQLKESLKLNFKNEVKTSSTIIGPHRDDFFFLLNNNNLKFFGSQGQQRGAVISLKLAEIPIFKKLKNNYPLLLLDDIFSELDTVKKNNFFKYIIKDIQTIITTTNYDNISPTILKHAKLIKIEKGLMKEVT